MMVCFFKIYIVPYILYLFTSIITIFKVLAIKYLQLIVFVGRVEEVVRGVKGEACLEVTAAINEALGEVIATKPTEEMYEQEVEVDQTNTLTDGLGSGEGGQFSQW